MMPYGIISPISKFVRKLTLGLPVPLDKDNPKGICHIQFSVELRKKKYAGQFIRDLEEFVAEWKKQK